MRWNTTKTEEVQQSSSYNNALIFLLNPACEMSHPLLSTDDICDPLLWVGVWAFWCSIFCFKIGDGTWVLLQGMSGKASMISTEVQPTASLGSKTHNLADILGKKEKKCMKHCFLTPFAICQIHQTFCEYWADGWCRPDFKISTWMIDI